MHKRLTSLFHTIAFGLGMGLMVALPVTARAQTVLMMAEEPGCIWCAAWNRDIGPVYDKTGEGAAAPLRRVDITDPIPDDITLARAINFTPTFVRSSSTSNRGGGPCVHDHSSPESCLWRER